MDRSACLPSESAGTLPVRFVWSYTAVIDGGMAEGLAARAEPNARQSFVSGDLADLGDYSQFDIGIPIRQY
jgi:hypothetical protein